MRRKLLTALGVLLSVSTTFAQIGIFTDSKDIGPNLPLFLDGEVNFANGVYTVGGSGSDVGRDQLFDEFFFVYKEISGSFSIQGDISELSATGEGGFMVRQDLDADSVSVAWTRLADLTLGGNTAAAPGTMFPHVRWIKNGGSMVDGDDDQEGASTALIGGYTSENVGPVRLDRIGNTFRFYTTNAAGEWFLQYTEEVQMPETVYVGLTVTANNNQQFGEFEFSNIVINEYPLFVNRTIPGDTVSPRQTISGVSLTAKARAGQTVNTVITERAPADIVLSNAQASSGTVAMNGRDIVWTLNGLSGEATLTYNLTNGPRSSFGLQGTFADANGDNYIGGDAVLPSKPAFRFDQDFVPLVPGEVTVIQIEDGARPFVTDQRNWEFIADPSLASGIALLHQSGGIAQYLEIPISIPNGYGDIFMFGNVFGPDGNADSFFVEIDLPLASNDTTIWDFGNGIPSGILWHLNWVHSRGPAEFTARRPFFDYLPGDTYAYIGGREGASMIDWIAFTNDPDSVDFATFSEVTPVEPVTVNEFMLY